MEFNATFLVSAISFIVFVFIMNAVLYKPMEQIVEKRQNFIDDTNLAAKNNFDESEKIIADKNSKISESKQVAKKFIADKTAQAQESKSVLQKQAQGASFEKIQNAKSDLYKSRDDAKNVLSADIEVLAGEISSKILG